MVKQDEAARAERVEEHKGALVRVYERLRDMRRRRLERKPWGAAKKGLFALTLVGGMAFTGAELIKHGHRQLGEDFAVGAVLLLLLLICVVCARHFLAQELE
jgi:hypothetical protein